MIDQIFSSIAQFVNRHPKVVMCIIAAIVVVAIFGTTMITMDTGDFTYIDQHSPEGSIDYQYSQTLNTDSIVLIVDTSDPLNPSVLKYIDRLEGDIRQQQYISGTESVVDVLKSENNGVLPQTKGEIDALVNEMPPAVQATAIPSNVLTLVQINLDNGLSTASEIKALDTVNLAVAQSNPPAGVTVEMSGTPAFRQQMQNEMSTNTGMLIGGALILMVIIMGLLFSYVSHRFLPVLFVGLGLTTAMGLMGLAGIPLTLAVMGAFPVMIGLGIDYAIQFHSRLDEEARKGSLDDAVFTTITKTGPAVMYAMLATSLGFAAMFVSTIPMVRSFGLVAMIGIMSCYCISLVGIPALAHLINYKPKPLAPQVCYAVGSDACNSLPTQKKKKPRSYAQFLTDASVKIAKNPVPILLIVALIAVIGYQIDPLIPIEANENNFVPPQMPAKIQIDKVTRVLGGLTTADIYVQGARVTDLDTIQWIEKYQDYELAHHADLKSATSIVTYILAYNGGVMPQTQSQVDAALDRMPEGIKDQYISGSMRGVIHFGMADLQMPQQEDLKKQMVSDIAFLQPPPGISVNPAGEFDIFTSLVAGLDASKDEMTYLGFGLIFVFLIVVYRHIHAISPLIPIILVVGWNSVVMYVLGIAYTPMTATLGSMTIGVAAEYTILVMERYSEEEEKLHDHIAAIKESVSKIGSAITVSGLATFFGFSALCLSTFPIISNFGISTLIAIGFSLFGAIFIMPAVLSLMGQFTEWLETRNQHRIESENLQKTGSSD